MIRRALTWIAAAALMVLPCGGGDACLEDAAASRGPAHRTVGETRVFPTRCARRPKPRSAAPRAGSSARSSPMVRGGARNMACSAAARRTRLSSCTRSSRCLRGSLVPRRKRSRTRSPSSSRRSTATARSAIAIRTSSSTRSTRPPMRSGPCGSPSRTIRPSGRWRRGSRRCSSSRRRASSPSRLLTAAGALG